MALKALSMAELRKEVLLTRAYRRNGGGGLPAAWYLETYYKSLRSRIGGLL